MVFFQNQFKRLHFLVNYVNAMSVITLATGGPQTSQAVSITGANGTGYLSMATQSTVPVSQDLALFNMNGTLAIKPAGVPCVQIAATPTVNRVLTLPDITDTVLTNTSTATMSNKTITGGTNGNTVSANMLQGVSVNASTPTTNQVLALGANGVQWYAVSAIYTPTVYNNLPIELSQTVTSSAYINVTTPLNNGQFIFPGSAAVGALTRVWFVAGGRPNTFPLFGSNTCTGAMRVYDVTNAQTICEITNMAGLPQVMYTATAQAVSTGVAVWQIQAKRTSANNTNNFKPTACMLQFN